MTDDNLILHSQLSADYISHCLVISETLNVYRVMYHLEIRISEHVHTGILGACQKACSVDLVSLVEEIP